MRALLDYEGPVHIGFAEPQIGVEQNGALRRLRSEAHRNRIAGPIAEIARRAGRRRHPQLAVPDKRGKCDLQ